MADLSTSYLGLKLRNPIIVASGPKTSNIESLKKCEENGAGAVVLKSIFEEQIETEVGKQLVKNSEFLDHSDFSEYFTNVSKDYYLDSYLKLLQDAKRELSIPVIASINCSDISTWEEYISSFEKTGADAIELNYYPIAQDRRVSGEDVDKALFKFAKRMRKSTNLPVSIKMGDNYSSLAYTISELDKIGINGLVLFNRFFRPDIDIENEKMSHLGGVSSFNEYAPSLRWIALMSSEVKCSLAANRGIHSSSTVIKMLLAGAAACQICTVYLKDETIIKTMCDELSAWMDKKNYKTIDEFKGKMAQENLANGSAWERTQYMKTLIGGDK